MRRTGPIRRFGIGFKELASRLTGFSTPVFGVSWEPPDDERGHVRAFLIALEDRRALFAPYHAEVEFAVVRSVEEIRALCTTTLPALGDSATAASAIRAIRGACRRFLTEAPDVHGLFQHGYDFDDRAAFFTSLGELRATIGAQVAALAVAYGIDFEDDLASIVPPEDSEAKGDLPAK